MLRGVRLFSSRHAPLAHEDRCSDSFPHSIAHRLASTIPRVLATLSADRRPAAFSAVSERFPAAGPPWPRAGAPSRKTREKAELPTNTRQSANQEKDSE